MRSRDAAPAPGVSDNERGPRSPEGSRAPSISFIGARSGRERMSAPAATGGVRVLEREPRTLHRGHVVDGDVVQVLGRKRVDKELEALRLDDEVILGRLVFDKETVFEAAAAAGL